MGSRRSPTSDRWARAMELAERQHAAVTRRQLDQLGIDRRMVRTRLAARVLTEPRPGVLVLAGAPPSFEQRLMVATLAAGGAVASHRAAARLHGLDGFGSGDDPRGLGRCPSPPQAPGCRRPRGAGTGEGRPHVVRGIPTTGIARTLADLGSVCEPDRVLQALDDARRRRLSTAWIASTRPSASTGQASGGPGRCSPSSIRPTRRPGARTRGSNAWSSAAWRRPSCRRCTGNTSYEIGLAASSGGSMRRSRRSSSASRPTAGRTTRSASRGRRREPRPATGRRGLGGAVRPLAPPASTRPPPRRRRPSRSQRTPA